MKNFKCSPKLEDITYFLSLIIQFEQSFQFS